MFIVLYILGLLVALALIGYVYFKGSVGVREKFGKALIIIGTLLPIGAGILLWLYPGDSPTLVALGFGGFLKSLIAGGIAVSSGYKLVYDARKERAKAFQKANCEGCRFVRWDADKGVWFCVCPQPPKYDQQRCYSRELLTTEQKHMFRDLFKKIDIEQPKGLAHLNYQNAFIMTNCLGCNFADADAMKKGEKWCIRPEPPQYDHQRCYSREGMPVTVEFIRRK
jgi:hypothetical protein